MPIHQAQSFAIRNPLNHSRIHVNPPPRSQAQTPQQRKANIQYARNEEAKRGKPVDDQKRITRSQQEKEKKSPIGGIWLCK